MQEDKEFEDLKQKMLDDTKVKWYDIVIVVVCLSIVIGWVILLFGLK